MPQLGSLSGMMAKYKIQFRSSFCQKQRIESDEELFGELFNLYYNNHDLKLLLDLLAMSSGIEQSLRLLCMFDMNMAEMFEVTNLTGGLF